MAPIEWIRPKGNSRRSVLQTTVDELIASGEWTTLPMLSRKFNKSVQLIERNLEPDRTLHRGKTKVRLYLREKAERKLTALLS